MTQTAVETEFTKKDLYHLDELIAEVVTTTTAVALPGAEALRNKIARRIGMPEVDEGEVTWDLVSSTDYFS